jgi:hypothetical protein
MANGVLTYALEGTTALVQMDDGKANALSVDMIDALLAALTRAEGEAKAISQVFDAVHQGNPDEGLLRYTYLQMLPQLAQGEANKVFVIPGEITQALGQVGERGHGPAGDGGVHGVSS